MENKEIMSKKSGNRFNRKKMELPLTIAAAALLWFIVMVSFFAKNDIKPTAFYPVSGYMSTYVYLTDSGEEYYPDGDFGWLLRGEEAWIEIDVPDTVDLNDAELYVPLYNAVVNVYYDARPHIDDGHKPDVLYEDEYDENNPASHYGGRIYWAELPSDYREGKVILDITAIENIPFSDLNKAGIIPTGEGWKKIIEGRSVIFSTSLALMVMALICIFYFAVRSIGLKKMQVGLPIAVFEFVINAWFFGSLGMFYLLVGNKDFCAKVEYYALYFATIPLAFFIYSVLDVPVMKRIILVLMLIYTSFYVVTTIIELSPLQINYSTMMSGMHILAGITIIMLVVAIFAGTRHETNSYISILRYGVLISLLCGVVELVRFNLTKYLLRKTWFATHGLSAVAILIIAVSLVVYLISISAEEYTNKIERKQLIELAFKDALTDMPNRAECYRQIEKMEADKIREYSMVFIDLNNLKTANDVYGHETGDRLLKMTADHIKAVFSDNGFCARWGGDEFIACVVGEESLALKCIKEFQLLMNKENESGSFPFKVSAACGCRHSDEDNYLEPIEAIREADAIMYENKKMMKAGR